MLPHPSDKQKEILAYAPLIAGWIKKGTPLTENELVTLKSHYAHLCHMLSGTTCAELKRYLLPFMTHPVYGGYIKVIISPDGERWLSDAIEMIKRT
jgi:hypothetical protein